MVLGLVLHEMCGLDTLRNHPKSTIRRLLDSVIHVHILGRQNEEHKLGTKFIRIAHRIEKVFHGICAIVASLHNNWVGIQDNSAMPPIGSDELFNERSYVFSGRSANMG